MKCSEQIGQVSRIKESSVNTGGMPSRCWHPGHFVGGGAVVKVLSDIVPNKMRVLQCGHTYTGRRFPIFLLSYLVRECLQYNIILRLHVTVSRGTGIQLDKV